MGCLQLVPLLATFFILVQANTSWSGYWASKIRQGDVQGDESKLFCSEFDLLCKDDVPIFVNDLNNYEPPYAMNISNNPSHYFTVPDLVPGRTFTMENMNTLPPDRPFLPTSISREIKLNSENMPQLLNMFGITKGSNMSQCLEIAVDKCSNSHHTCFFSIPAMQDYAMSTLGGPVRMLYTRRPSNIKTAFEAKVLGVRRVKPATEPNVACHAMMSPFQLYSCHSLPETEVYKVVLDLKEHGVLDAVATCHVNTSSWDKSLPVFETLKIKPGEGTVCHWIYGYDLTWIKA